MKMQKCDICQKEFKNLGAHNARKHGESRVPSIVPTSDEELEKQGLPTSGIRPATMDEAAQYDPLQATLSNLNKTLTRVLEGQQKLEERVENIETGGKLRFKKEVNSEDVVKAYESRESVQDPRVLAIVDELLGSDFGVRLQSNKDKPGFMFSILVPPRLSPIGISERPVRKENPSHPRDYEKDPKTGRVITEEYHPEDIRSRAVSSTDSYDAIRDHCQKVQANIVAWHQKLSRPIPEFQTKSYAR